MSETASGKHFAEGSSAFFQDIIARKPTNEQLQFQAIILENVSESIIVTDLQGYIIYWNEGATALFGYSAQEMLGNTPAILYPPTETHQLQPDLEQIREGNDYISEWKGRRKDGTAVWLDIKTTLLRSSEGAAIGYIGVSKDITARKQIEEQLRQSRDQLNIILQHIADGITVQDTSGALVYANDAGAKLSGFASAQEMLAFDVETLRVHYLERFEMKDEFGLPVSFSDLPAMKALQGQRYAEALVNYIDRHTGRSLWSVVKASPIFDETGQVQFAVNIFSDLTERMELEQRKDEFIGMASHELKTPITSLKGFAQLLKRKLEKQGLPESVAMLNKMEIQLTRLTHLVTDLLDVSKIRAGKLDYAEETIDIDALVHDIADTLQQISTTHTITIQGASHIHIVGDSDRLGQVFTNLISNAVKYSPQANQVDISLAVSQNMVTVSVRDYGIGIPKEHQQKIFDRFYRVSEVHDQTFPGLGMGLYISSEIVKRHGGRLWVESTKGNGATFFISLPIA
ncbi:MAG: PAS domain S-box protein [Ktedonobacteraceae bacterium]